MHCVRVAADAYTGPFGNLVEIYHQRRSGPAGFHDELICRATVAQRVNQIFSDSSLGGHLHLCMVSGRLYQNAVGTALVKSFQPSAFRFLKCHKKILIVTIKQELTACYFYYLPNVGVGSKFSLVIVLRVVVLPFADGFAVSVLCPSCASSVAKTTSARVV